MLSSAKSKGEVGDGLVGSELWVLGRVEDVAATAAGEKLGSRSRAGEYREVVAAHLLRTVWMDRRSYWRIGCLS